MVSGWQRRQTEAMFKLFDFDAVLLSAGGNDLKNLFASIYDDVGNRAQGLLTLNEARMLNSVAEGKLGSDVFFEAVIQNIRFFIAMRDAAGSGRTRAAPLFIHGYDHLQPRPAPAKIFAGTSLGSGPWIYPSLKHAGLNDTEMLVAAKKVIDELNDRLRQVVQAMPADNVYFFDQRGSLDLAAPGSQTGFGKLCGGYWNP